MAPAEVDALTLTQFEALSRYQKRTRDAERRAAARAKAKRR
jgi:hypothetical protein